MNRTMLFGTSAMALVVALFSATARAQTAPPTTLPPLPVTAVQDGSLTVPSVEQQRQTLSGTAGSVGYVDSESYKGRYASNLRDVLADSPGVFVETRYGQELRLSIRGAGIARAFHTRGIEILQDGIPTNMADGSGDYYQIDPLALRSTEVYKGGNGLAYGSSTLGGAINFVTPTAYTAIAPNVARLSGGSYGTLQGNAQASRILGDADFLAGGTLSHSDGYRQHEQGDYGQFNGNAGYRLSPTLETRFYAGYYAVNQLLPGSLTLSQALQGPKQATAAALSGNQSRETRTERLANKTSIAVSSGQIAIASWVIHKDLYHPIFQVIDQDGTNYGIAPSYNGSFDLGGFRDEVISGVRVTGGSNLARQFINVYGSRAAATADAEQESFNLAAYAENRFFFLPTVALMTGVKVLRENRDYTDHLAPTKSAERTYDGVNPKVGLLWKPSKDIQVFGDVTRSQDVPDFSDLTQAQFGGVVGFVPLQAQHAWTGEIGTRGTYDRFGWDVTAYRSNVRDEFLNFTTNPNIPAATFNAPKTTHQGLELGGNVDLVRDVTGPNAGDRITLRQVWTYSDFAFDNDAVYKNNKIAGVPDNVLRTTLTYAQREGFYASPFVDWVPNGAWVDHANTLQAPGYALVGVETGYDFSNGVSIFFNGRNLGDNHYISDIGTVTNARKVATSVFYPGEGRSVYAGMRVKF